MKNSFIILSVLALTFTACTKEKNTTENTINTTEQAKKEATLFAVDSISVNDSLRVNENLLLSYKSNILMLPSIKNKAVLDSIYHTENILLKEYSPENLKEALNLKKKNYFEEQKKSMADFTPVSAQKWNSNSNMKVFSNEFDYLTIQYSGDGFTGGAHGYYYEKYKVFDLKNNKTLQLDDVISEKDPKIWDRILSDNFFKNDADRGQAEMLLVKQIPLNNNFYFDKEYLYFLYNQYEITAYAAGTVLIKVPLSDIKLFLQSDFKERLSL